MKTIASLILVIVVLFGGAIWYSSLQEDSRENLQKKEERDALRFSNTAEWDPALIVKADPRFSPRFIENWRSRISLPHPPTNSSEETTRELAKLREDISIRTPEVVEAIRLEVDAQNTQFGQYRMTYYLNESLFPKTARLLAPIIADVETAVILLKKEFDRVRPSVLDPELVPVIPVPGHPAYPSGHSTQAHFLAYFLSELDPENSGEYERRALEIAVHREIAGLHYPSDTAVGKLLARQYMDALLENEEFVRLLEDARSEWD